MALNTFVLINAVTNLSDARYCAGMHVNLIGFGLEEGNESYIAPETFKELTEWLSGVDYVGEFEHSEINKITEVIEQYDISYVQVQDESLVAPLKKQGKKVILKTPLSESLDITAEPDFLLVKSDDERLEQSDLSLLKELSKRYAVVLGTGITAENVDQLIRETGIHGISLMGGNEIKPGYKDYDELADILEELEIDDMA